jgi:hypothetical protein
MFQNENSENRTKSPVSTIAHTAPHWSNTPNK